MTAMLLIFFFFFQAEDGIRDIGVTGVQTCALPIYMDVFNVCEELFKYNNMLMMMILTMLAVMMTTEMDDDGNE